MATSDEPVVNAAAMAALDKLTADMRREADRQTDARVAGRMGWCANSLAMALARCAVRELGGEATGAVYDSDFGDDRECTCGHAYYRHFDWMDEMRPVGCKYCRCFEFSELGGEVRDAT